jgi:hypothetical protein
LVGDCAIREKMQGALAQWHAPKAAEQIAEEILRSAGLDLFASEPAGEAQEQSSPPAGADQAENVFVA